MEQEVEVLGEWGAQARIWAGCPLPHLFPTKGWVEHRDNVTPHPTAFCAKKGSGSLSSGERPLSAPPTSTGRAALWVTQANGVAGPPLPMVGSAGQTKAPTRHPCPAPHHL